MTAVEPGTVSGGLFDRATQTGRLMQAQDWSTTALGSVESWPETLKISLRLMLASAAPTFIWWGPDLIHLHNDACARLFGRRRVLGRPAAEIRRDIWNAIGAEVWSVVSDNNAMTVRERRVTVSRNGRERDVYCTFQLTPIRDEWGAVVGVIGVGDDETPAVVARQRLSVLRALKDLANAESTEMACEWAAAAIAAHARDVPYALIYLADPDGEHATLAGSAGRVPDGIETRISRDHGSGAWLLADERPGEPLRRVHPVPPQHDGRHEGADGAVALRLERVRGRDGYLIAGIAGRGPIDDDLRAFLIAVAGLVSAGLVAACAREEAAREPDEQHRNEFLAMLAHELRNPLAPIRSAAELLGYVEADPGTLSQAREIIERQLGQLVRLVDDLLDASRLSRGTLELKRTAVDLRTPITNAIESVRPLIDAARHDLEIHMPPSAVRVHGDAVRLTQTVANVLTNAAQYTEPGGHIVVALDKSDREARLTVADNGIGFEEPLGARIFEMFTQGEQRPGEPRHGLGLGLAMAKRLVELHGGTIEAHSPGRGRGSRLAVTLPLLTRSRSPSGVKANGHDELGRRILVADDNTDAATAMAEVLGAVGHDVRTAVDGIEAIEVAERFRPQLILLDIGMPRLDGYETCRRIRQRPWGRDVAIYAVTGWGQPSDRRRTREAGFNAHLVKPVSISVIQELMTRGETKKGADAFYSI